MLAVYIMISILSIQPPAASCCCVSMDTPPMPSVVLIPMPEYSAHDKSVLHNSASGGESRERIVRRPVKPGITVSFNRKPVERSASVRNAQPVRQHLKGVGIVQRIFGDKPIPLVYKALNDQPFLRKNDILLCLLKGGGGVKEDGRAGHIPPAAFEYQIVRILYGAVRFCRRRIVPWWSETVSAVSRIGAKRSCAISSRRETDQTVVFAEGSYRRNCDMGCSPCAWSASAWLGLKEERSHAYSR